jgi:membrane associated rhomboid family serine protease
MIPLKDNVATRTLPIITISVILVNILIFLWSLNIPAELERDIVHRYALIPRELYVSCTSRPDLLAYNIGTMFTSMFLHGGILHLGGNMLYLWIFGRNVEDTTGHLRFAVFYLLSGLVAALVQCSFDPTSAVP